MPRSNKRFSLKFLLDENVDVRLTSFLKEKDFSTKICPKGIRNGEVFRLAKKESRILLTNDKDFANEDLYPPAESAGIIVFRIHPPSLSNLTEALEKLFEISQEKELRGKLCIVRKDGAEFIQ